MYFTILLVWLIAEVLLYNGNKKGGKMMARVDLFVLQVERQKEGEPNVVFVMVPPQLSSDFDALHKKLENSVLNELTYLPKWGKISRTLHIEGASSINMLSDDVQPISFSDWANIILSQLNQHMQDEEEELSSKLEDELIFFIGEFTLLRDGSI